MTTVRAGALPRGTRKMAGDVALLRFHGMDREAWNASAKRAASIRDHRTGYIGKTS